MAEIRFTNAAAADLVEIDQFSCARFGEEIGEAYMRGFDQAFKRLSEFPLIGQPVPHVAPELRCLRHRCHGIYYHLAGGDLLILRILHHARDTQATLAEEAKRS